MDNISNLFKNLNSRLSSPFFFSFLISWCVFNWQIIIALLFYKNTEVQLDGYHSYIDLIKENTTFANNFGWPLVWAFVYTFLYPLFKNGIDAFQAWSNNWGDKLVFRVSKTSQVSIRKYLQLREAYEKNTNALAEVLKNESEHLNQNEKFKNDNLDLSIKNNSLFEELSKWKDANNVNIISGEWFYNYTLNSEGKIETKNYELIIQSDQIEIIDNNSRIKVDIQGFYNDPINNRITFTLKNTKGVYEHFDLRKTDTQSLNLLKGKSNKGKIVEFIRQRPIGEELKKNDTSKF